MLPGPSRRSWGVGGAKLGCERTRAESWGCGAEALREARAGRVRPGTHGEPEGQAHSPARATAGSTSVLAGLSGGAGGGCSPVSVSPTATFSVPPDKNRGETNA